MVWCGVVGHVVWCGMVWCGMVWYGMIWYDVWCGEVIANPFQKICTDPGAKYLLEFILHSLVVWYGKVCWHVVWHGMWCGMVWYGLV